MYRYTTQTYSDGSV